ncbi:transposase [Streptomyces sp. NPDC056835]|uniref:transposase n=1 Tax=Streptomyces sp. NPDC056835 TaxID=3345956 RepID=UPI003696630C
MTRVQLSGAEWEFIGPYLPIGEYGPYAERLRLQFAGVIWRFRTGGQWREMPAEFGARPTVHNRFRQWRDAGVFDALLEGLIAEAAERGEADLSLVSVDSTTARAHHDAVLYKERNTVERLINKLKAWRGIGTRYDKTPASYLAGPHLRASMIWIKDLTRTAG